MQSHVSLSHLLPRCGHLRHPPGSGHLGDVHRLQRCGHGTGSVCVQEAAEKLYPAKNIYTKENVEKFLKTKGKEAEEAFAAKKEEIAIDKETGATKTYANGKPRKKGYVAALKWFKEEYGKEFLEFIK